MKTRPTLFTRLKDWIASLQERFFILDEWQGDQNRYEFSDPFRTMDDLHDQEMERLVKTIEQTRSENSARY